MSDQEFEVAGHAYRAGRLNAFQQMHVVRRLAPVASSFAGVFNEIQRQGGRLKVDPLTVLRPLMDAVSKIPDEDLEYILRVCLKDVMREVGNDKGWSRLVTADGTMMYADADNMVVMLQIAWGVLERNLGSFFDELLSASLELETGEGNLKGDGSASPEGKTGSSDPSTADIAALKA